MLTTFHCRHQGKPLTPPPTLHTVEHLGTSMWRWQAHLECECGLWLNNSVLSAGQCRPMASTLSARAGAGRPLTLSGQCALCFAWTRAPQNGPNRTKSAPNVVNGAISTPISTAVPVYMQVQSNLSRFFAVYLGRPWPLRARRKHLECECGVWLSNSVLSAGQCRHTASTLSARAGAGRPLTHSETVPTSTVCGVDHGNGRLSLDRLC